MHADGTGPRPRHRPARRLRRMAAAAPAHLPSHHRPDPDRLRGQPVHLFHRRFARRRRPGAARRADRHGPLHRPAAAGAGADRHRHRLRHHGAVPGGVAGLARPDRQRPRRRGGWIAMTAHLVIAPLLIPLAVAALQLLAGTKRRRLASALSLASCVLLLLVAAGLMWMVAGPAAGSRTFVYAIGDWPARFAIVLVADRLSVLMLLLTSVLALAVMPYALGRWQYRGARFQPLMQLLLLGLNGAFLTGDLFNLSVCFEVLLAASYGLALHGSGARRTSAGLHYIAINLAASMLFLLGVSLIFGVTGTLSMAELARKIPTLPEHTRNLLHGGAALLGLAFLVKTAVWPLGFWLPRTYSAATPPVAAMFSIMTKLGIYVLLRLSLLLFGAGAGQIGRASWR